MAMEAIKGMDWYSWLCRTGLEAALVYEYALVFSQNELEEEDIAHFSHEFLLSMGISIAKHRLEILKLAKKERRGLRKPVSRFLAVIRKTKRSIAEYVRELVRREEDSALVVVPQPVPRNPYGKAWRGALIKRSKRLVMVKQGRLMLTNGSAKVTGPVPPVAVRDSRRNVGGGSDEGDGYWEGNNDGEEIKWDSMFQDLKPT